jgi:hypothetical protein
MSYELVFHPPERESTDLDEEATTAPGWRTWRRVVKQTRAVLAGVEVTRTDRFGEIDHPATGIQLWLSATAATISAPYWHVDDAAEVIATVYRLAEIVEAETTLTGFDPQMDRPVRDARQTLDLVAQYYANVAGMFARQQATRARAAARREAGGA